MDGPLISRIDTIFVPALNPQQAAEWYRRLFSLETVFEEADYVALRFPDCPSRRSTALTLKRVATIDRDAHAAFNFFAANPEQLRAALISEGVEASPIQSSGGMTHFDFRDISGNWVNVCHF